MHLFILETGAPPAPLDQEFGRYPAMFKQVLSADAPSLSFSTLVAADGAPLPSPAEFDALLITGSPAGVYEGHDWIAPAEALVRATATVGKPQIGVCFGHQLMARAFGGEVEKSEKGWGVGLHRYKVDAGAEWMTPGRSHFACAVSHQDQVTELPDGARVLASSDFCPFAMIDYAQAPAMSLQPHPEFSHQYAGALMRLRKGRIPADRIDTGLASLEQRSDRDLLAQWIINFLFNHAR